MSSLSLLSSLPADKWLIPLTLIRDTQIVSCIDHMARHRWWWAPLFYCFIYSTNMEDKRILFVGLICVDIVNVVKEFPKEDSDHRYRYFFGPCSWRRSGLNLSPYRSCCCRRRGQDPHPYYWAWLRGLDEEKCLVSQLSKTAHFIFTVRRQGWIHLFWVLDGIKRHWFAVNSATFSLTEQQNRGGIREEMLRIPPQFYHYLVFLVNAWEPSLYRLSWSTSISTNEHHASCKNKKKGKETEKKNHKQSKTNNSFTLTLFPSLSFITDTFKSRGIKANLIYHEGHTCPLSIVILNSQTGSRTILHGNKWDRVLLFLLLFSVLDDEPVRFPSFNLTKSTFFFNRSLPEVTLDDFKKINLSNYNWIHFEVVLSLS